MMNVMFYYNANIVPIVYKNNFLADFFRNFHVEMFAALKTDNSLFYRL